MPISCSILSAKNVGHAVPPGNDPATVAGGIAEAAHFNVQAASDLYWLGSQNDYSLGSDFGPLRLPFPTVWMEWTVPAEVLIKGKKARQRPTRVGCLLMEEPCGDDHGYVIGCASVVVDIETTSEPQLSPLLLRFQLDENGHFTGDRVRYRFNNDALDEVAAHNRYVDDLKHLLVAGLALNLINCKNVTTEVAGHVPVRRSGSQKRRGEPKIEYSTIRLPGSPSGSEATGENEGIMPLHRVRGHFKTFTDEAPMLGKHTGTYWWGWQVRGKASNGEVISDYELRDVS